MLFTNEKKNDERSFVVVWNYRYQNSSVTVLLMWHIDRQTFDELASVLFLPISNISVLDFSIVPKKTQTLIY